MANPIVKKKAGFKFNFAEPQHHISRHHPHNLDNKTTILYNDKNVEIQANELQSVAELGKGAYGIVEKMRHSSGVVLAVKRMSASVSRRDDKENIRDIDIAMRSSGCPYTVQFFGALYWEGDIWICMEVMDASLDKFYPEAFKKNVKFPEAFLGKTAFAVVNALHYLYSQLKVIHRDVKPSNILVNRKGEVKLCDFGISGYLVNSIAKTGHAGSKAYMAPERIDPKGVPSSYDIRSDVWSLGISLIEIATGKYPYGTWPTPFEQLKQVVTDSPPRLPQDSFSEMFCDFISVILVKDHMQRPKYEKLLQHQFLCEYENTSSCILADFINSILPIVVIE